MNYRDRINQTLQHCAVLEPCDLKLYQQRLLERLCRHAALNTDWYRQSAASMFSDGDPEGGRWLPEKWTEMPIVERSHITPDPSRFHSSTVPRGQYESGETSGSTNAPLKYRKSGLGNLASIGVAERAFAQFGFDFAATFADIRVIIPSGRPARKTYRWNSKPNAGDHLTFEIRRPIDEQWAWLKSVQPDYLMSYPSNLRSLAKMALIEPDALHLKACVASAEILSDDVRELIRTAFGADTVSLYGLRELGHVATDCPEGGKLHLAADVTLIEVLRDDGEPAGPGEFGQIVATSLYNHAMPFIRYATGDFGEVGEPCSCGWKLPVLRCILGRRRNRFLLPDGRKIWPGQILQGLDELFDVDDFRLEQIAADHFRFTYVGGGDRPDLEEKMPAEVLSSAFGCPVNIETNRVLRIKPSGYAKQERFISDMI